jgi:hypothetical protein
LAWAAQAWVWEAQAEWLEEWVAWATWHLAMELECLNLKDFRAWVVARETSLLVLVLKQTLSLSKRMALT